MEAWSVMLTGKKMTRIKSLKDKMANLKWMMMLLLNRLGKWYG